MSGTISKKDLDKQIMQGVDKLYEELKIGHLKPLTNYLTSAMRLQYSPNNLMLIYLQYPQATLLKTYKKWSTMGYQVRKGEKSIKVLQPRPFVKTVEVDGEEEERTKVYFSYIDLFDISQVKKVREDAVDLSGYTGLANTAPTDQDCMQLYDEMKAVMNKVPIEVIEKPILLGMPSVEGASFGGLVEIKYASSQNMYIALGHEWSHEILHQGSNNKAYSKNYKECQAEATAYIVCGALGVESPMSKDYILGWGNTAEDFKTNLEMVIKASNVMLDSIYNYRGVSESENTLSAENIA